MPWSLHVPLLRDTFYTHAWKRIDSSDTNVSDHKAMLRKRLDTWNL